MKKPGTLLVCLLAISSLITAGAGVVLKQTSGSESPLVQETLAVAVPFLYLRGEVVKEEHAPAATDKWQPDEQLLQGAEPDPVSIDLAEQIPQWIKGGLANTGEEQAASVFVPVEEEYFNTALFIGDSRTEGLKLYGRLGEADYFANVGMSVFNLFEKSASDMNFPSQTLECLLSTKQYDTIYLSLGINEMGYPWASLEARYTDAVEKIRSWQPQANLILLGNLSVTREKAASSDVLKLENVKSINGLLASFADGEKIFYLDPNTFFSDEEGYLRSEVTGDGVHPYATEYRNWAIWLKDYGIK